MNEKIYGHTHCYSSLVLVAQSISSIVVNFGCGQSEYNMSTGADFLQMYCMYGLRWDEEAAASASDLQSGISKGRGRLEHAC
jgi:hypothetical protein